MYLIGRSFPRLRDLRDLPHREVTATLLLQANWLPSKLILTKNSVWLVATEAQLTPPAQLTLRRGETHCGVGFFNVVVFLASNVDILPFDFLLLSTHPLGNWQPPPVCI